MLCGIRTRCRFLVSVDAFFLGSLIPGQETVGKASLCYEERIMSNNNNWVPCAYKAPVDGLYV